MSATALGILLALVSAPVTSAQSDEGIKTAPAAVTREAYFTSQAGGVVPATLTNEFPPGVVCIVVPQACSSQVQPITGPLGAAIPDIVTPDRMAPQLVEPNTLPVALSGGKPRYQSYLRFDLPKDIPNDALLDRFELVLSEGTLTYALESPAFRRAVLGALATYQGRDPNEIAKVVADVASQTSPLATTRITGIELCAVTAPWPPGPNQDASNQPPRDCVFGANGVRDPAAKTWTFDLSFLAQAWLEGTVPNEGVYLGPLGAENLAFGDPDTSTNWQVSLFTASAGEPTIRPRLRYAFSPGLGGDVGLEDFTGDLGLEEFSETTMGSLDPFTAEAPDGSFFDAASDVTEADTPVDESRPALRSRVASSNPRTPWWVWLVLPLIAGGGVAYERSMASAPLATAGGGGALTRLMNRNSSTR